MGISGNISSTGQISGNITVGAGGTKDYEELENLPKINNVELVGNKTAAQLGLATPEDIPPVIDYSTEEQNTGVKWVDGKYIYQKTYNITAPSGSGSHSVIDLTSINIDKFINYKSIGYYLDYLYTYPNRTAFFAIEQNILKMIVRDDNWGSYNIYITIFYTKNEV